MPKIKEVDVPFPLSGLDENGAFQRQPTGTTVDCQNVRAYDPATDRARGAQRAGLEKYSSQTITGDLIQDLNHIVVPLDPGGGTTGYSIALNTSGFSILDADGNIVYSDSSGVTYYDAVWGPDGSVYPFIKDGSNNLIIKRIDIDGVEAWSLTLETSSSRDPTGIDIEDGTVYAWVADPGGTAGNKSKLYRIDASGGITLDGGAWKTDSDGIIAPVGTDPDWYQRSRLRTSSTQIAISKVDATSLTVQLLDIDAGTEDSKTGIAHNVSSPTDKWAAGLDHDGDGNWYAGAQLDSNTLVVKLNTSGAQQWSYTVSGRADDLAYDAANDRVLLSGVNFDSTDDIVELDVSDGTKSDGADLSMSGSLTSIDVDSAGKVYVSQAGNSLRQVSADLSTTNWTTSLASTQAKHAVQRRASIETQPTRRIVQLAVSSGSIYRVTTESASLASSGSGALRSDTSFIFSAVAFGKVYYVDGASYKVYDHSNNTVSTWSASPGTLPTDSDSTTARLIELWRGRVMLSGLKGDPHNWFASKFADPDDWDYSPSTLSELQAVAGNNSDAGKIGDVVNAMVPYSDDIMIFGCDHSIWQCSGDPMGGGRIDRLSDITGMSFGRPWATDARGVIYFFGSKGGVYRMAPGGLPESMTDNRIKREMEDINLEENQIRLTWNHRHRGLHVWVMNYAGSASRHYFWDSRTDSWWPDTFGSTDLEPSAVHLLDGDSPNDRVLLLGCRDGNLRKVSDTAKDDDGTAISSYVWLGPVQVQGGHAKFVLMDSQVILGADSDDVTYEVYGAETAEAAFNGSARFSGTLSSGRNRTDRRRAEAHALYLKLSNSTAARSWAFEQWLASLKVAGPKRRRAY